MTDAIAELFAKTKQENRAALIAYIPAGFPSRELCLKLIDALVENGVDLIEIGYPYSDPLMDGPTIQEAVQSSLDQGVKATDVFDSVARVNQAGAVAVVMSYYNPLFKYGSEKFLENLRNNGGAGVITPDLIPDEASDWLRHVNSRNLDNIFLVAPSSTDERIELVAENASGFIYAASLMGVTGVKSAQSSNVAQLVSRVRSKSDLPVCVGLGVNNPDQVREIAQFADGVIVGSAFIREILNAANDEAAVARVGELAAALSDATSRTE